MKTLPEIELPDDMPEKAKARYRVLHARLQKVRDSEAEILEEMDQLLIESLPPPPEIMSEDDPEFLAELERRLKEAEEHPETLIPHEQVMADLYKRRVEHQAEYLRAVEDILSGRYARRPSKIAPLFDLAVQRMKELAAAEAARRSGA